MIALFQNDGLALFNILVGVASFFATLLTVLIAWLPRLRKRLFYDVVCEINVPSPQVGGSRGDPLRMPPHQILVIDVQNWAGRFTGWISGIDIATTQYERNISFSFGKQARVIEAHVIEEHPPGFGVEFYIEGSHEEKLVLKPVLLNRGDWIRLKVMVENPTEPVSAAGRILGIKKIQKRWSGLQLYSYGLLLAFLIAISIDTLPRWVGWLLTGDMFWMLGISPLLYTAWLGIIAAGLSIALAMVILGRVRLKRAQKVAEELGAERSIPESER